MTLDEAICILKQLQSHYKSVFYSEKYEALKMAIDCVRKYENDGVRK